ncbi:MAG: metalloregulator ArsR/SmtB family transcription factor [candidate division WOR-3 bacterium]
MEKFLKIFNALSDETRLRIFLLLTRSELCVCELMNILNMKQPRISHCLRILKEAGLIENKREGQRIIYSANPGICKSKLIDELKKEVVLSPEDLKNLKRCRKKEIRKKE